MISIVVIHNVKYLFGPCRVTPIIGWVVRQAEVTTSERLQQDDASVAVDSMKGQ